MSTIEPISYDGYGAGIQHLYPYTDFHEMNLDWLLSTYKAILDKTNNIISWVNTHQIEYEDAIARLTAVEQEISSFEAEVRQAFADYQAQMDADFARQKAELEAALAQTEAQVDAEIQRMINEVNAAISEFDGRFNQLSNQIQAELASIKVQVNEVVGQLQRIIIENNEFLFQYVENRLDQFIHDFPEIIGIQVYNPIKGEYTSLQQAILDIYDVACVYGLTCFQFEELGLSATEFDATNITAAEFDQYGYNILDYPDERYYMYDPFDGSYNLVKNVVMKLANLHMDIESLSATEFDALDISAEDFDDSDITAFQFDWFSKTILSA